MKEFVSTYGFSIKYVCKVLRKLSLIHKKVIENKLT